MPSKPTLFEGQEYPYNQLLDRDFERLLYQIFQKDIENGLFTGRYDQIDLMQGVGERGRDSILYLNSAKVGVIQCKKYNERLTKPTVTREIIKFVLHYLKDNTLITNPNDFTYYLAASKDFSGPAIDLLSDFGNKITNEPQLEEWTNQVINSNIALQDLHINDVRDNLYAVLCTIKVEKITPDMLDLKLASYPELLPLFFEIEKVVIPLNTSPLSTVPLTARPLVDQVLIGRELELSWLNQSQSDGLLVGQPGIGKTFLLYKFALEREGCFVVSRDRGEIENAIRTQRPEILIVDDAHSESNYELLLNLKQIRVISGINFSLFASCWPGDEDKISQALNLPQLRIHHLGLLTRDEIVQVIENLGLSGSGPLIREIVDQAEGRPGLAVTLAQLCLQGGIREVVLGNELSRSILNFFKPLLGQRASLILAAFSVGGEMGMEIGVVANQLLLSEIELLETITELAAGGVIQKIDKQRFVVRPRALRYALIRDIFFNGLSSGLTFLQIEPLLEKVTSLPDAVMTLIEAKGRGAAVPPKLLIDRLEQIDQGNIWEAYTSLGESEAQWVITHHPEKVIAVARSALHNVPKQTIPLLLDEAIKDQTPLHSNPNHPLRLIEDWVSDGRPGTGQALTRRQVLFEVVQSWLSKGSNSSVGLRTLLFILSPRFDSYLELDPGSSLRVTQKYGYLLREELKAIEDLWSKIIDLVKQIHVDNWEPICTAIESWAYPRSSNLQLSTEILDELKVFAVQMLTDIVEVAKDRPGVLHWAHQIARRINATIEIRLDPDFEILYPEPDFSKDWQAELEHQSNAVRELAKQWSTLDPTDIAKRIAMIEEEAVSVNIRGPRLLELMCKEIARQVPYPLDWAWAMVNVGLTNDIVFPFLAEAASINNSGWDDLANLCLDKPELRGAVISLVLTMSNPPQDLLNRLLLNLQGFASIVETHSLRNEISESIITQLLRHSDQAIAVAAAQGEWYAEPAKVVRDSLRKDWEAVVIRHTSHESWLEEVLRGDSTLAYQWLLARIADENTVISRYEITISAAASALDIPPRLNILNQIPEDYGFDEIILYLVNDQLDLYKALLEQDRLRHYHLVPLSGTLSDLWIEKAKLALDVGYSARKIAYAVYYLPFRSLAWVGDESNMWTGWINTFESLCSHEDEGIQQIGKAGKEYATNRKEEALKRERNEAIYGRSWDRI